VTFLGSVFGFISDLVNPVLSPVLWGVNTLGTWLGDVIFGLLGVLPPWLGLTILSAIIGVIALLAFKYTSNQKKIGYWRDQMSGHLLVLKLYKDEIGVAFRAQRRLAVALAIWQWHMLRPLILMIILLMPLFAQMATRYQWRPMQTGEQTNIRVRLTPGLEERPSVALQPCDELADIVGPVAGGDELVWRVRASAVGRHTLRFDVDGTEVTKELVVGEPYQRVSAERPARRWTGQVLHPAESPLPSGVPLAGIVVEYEGVESYITGADWWVVYLLVVSMIAAIACLPFFKVRF